jgi:DNA-binding NarL/FixJ family response regulator
VLEARKGISIVGEAATGKAALKLVKRFRPDLVTIDIGMPDISGLDLIEQILDEHPTTSIFVISGHGTRALVHHALRMGVKAFITKVSVCKTIRDAFDSVGRGDVYVEPDVRARLRLTAEDLEMKSPLESLSKREREILEMVVGGKTSAEIARVLKISAKSVDSYRSRMMAKIGVEHVTNLVKFAVSHGLAGESP